MSFWNLRHCSCKQWVRLEYRKRFFSVFPAINSALFESLLTIWTVLVPVLLDLFGCQTMFRVGWEVVTALLPSFHISILHFVARIRLKLIQRWGIGFLGKAEDIPLPLCESLDQLLWWITDGPCKPLKRKKEKVIS